MKDFEIIISQTGESVYVRDCNTKELKLFSKCDYESLDHTLQAARDYIKTQENG